MVILLIKYTGITKCSNMVAKILPGASPDPWAQKVKFVFSEQCHIAYRLKGNHKCSNMVSISLPADTRPFDPGDWVNRPKVNFFSEYGHAAYQIKRNHKSLLQTPPHTLTLGDGVNRSKVNFFRTWLCCISNKRSSRNIAADPTP